MAEPLIATKVLIPPSRVGSLPRRRLVDLLNGGYSPTCRLILICAPAGYGKTTLAAEWARASASEPAAKYCWLSLEEEDNSVYRFEAYLLTSLQKALPDLGRGAAALLESPQPPAPGALLAALVNDLTGVTEPVFLVLDDYHKIHSPAIHDSLAYLIDHGPQNLHLGLTTRSDPPLPLHRYRARGQMVEVRLDDLRFTRAEAAEFLQGMLGFQLEPDQIEVLEQRTEGWVAGLQVAALSMRGKTDIAGFVRSLSGSHRYILDYLAEEALEGHPSLIQSFLLRTSLLEQLNAALCDAVLGQEFFSGADANFSSSQMILAYLEDRNLFLIALDDERRWYRYHSLFADLLRVRFNAGTAAQTAVLIQRRAAAWFEQQGDTRKAIRYFIQGGAYEEAARLVENQTIHLFSQGELQALVDAVQLLPAQLAERRPWLSIYQAWAMAFAGQLDQVERLLSIARLALTQEPPHAQDEHAMEAEMTAIRALSATQAGDFASVLPLADRLDLFPEDRLFASSVIYWSLGYAWRMLGDLPRAITAFRQVMALGERLNNRWTLLTASVDLGTVLRQTGRLEEAERIYRQGLERVSRPGGSGQGMLGRLESFLAGILYEKNELEEAGQLAENSVAHGQLWDNPNHVAHAHWMLARTRLARGDVHGAERVLKTAEEVAAKPAVVPSLKVSIEAERVRFWLSSGDLQRAQVWLAGQSLATGSTPLSETAVVVLTLAARVKIASGDTDGAAAVIDRLEANHRAGGRINDLIEALVLRALASGSTPAARSALDEALALGLPAGYRRIYLDHGARLRVLLVQWRAEIRSVSPAALDDLLAAFPQETAPDSAPQSADSILTDREIEILARMAEGLTNQEIGRRLYISTGTVKAHSAAIYRKLDVANRAEAIARAKDLNLL